MKSVLHITCDDCQAHLLTYLHNDATPLMRRRVARHLDHCEACYTLYQQELQLMRELKRAVPHIGAGNSANFDRVWRGIQAEIRQPSGPRFQMRYGLAMLALILVFLVPMTMGNQNLSLTALPPPAPIAALVTPDLTAPSKETTVALLLNEYQTTPEAPGGTTAPAVGLTSTP
jgi:anti-sigma factor RsiW